MINTISIVFGVLGTIVGVLGAIAAIWQKVSSERRLKSSSQAEINTKLSKLFAELVWTANGRAGNHVSDKCIEQLFEKGFITKQDLDNETMKKKIEKTCILNLPVGQTSQEAIIISLGVLGNRYEILHEPAKTALESFGNHLVDKSDQSDMAVEMRKVIQKAQVLLNGK